MIASVCTKKKLAFSKWATRKRCLARPSDRRRPKRRPRITSPKSRSGICSISSLSGIRANHPLRMAAALHPMFATLPGVFSAVWAFDSLLVAVGPERAADTFNVRSDGFGSLQTRMGAPESHCGLGNFRDCSADFQAEDGGVCGQTQRSNGTCASAAFFGRLSADAERNRLHRFGHTSRDADRLRACVRPILA